MIAIDQLKQLKDHFESTGKGLNLSELFKADKARAEKMSVKLELPDGNKLLFDYSKNLVNQETIELLISLAEKCNLPEKITKMFAGKKINTTEGRAVLHTALRTTESDPTFDFVLDGLNVKEAVLNEREKMYEIAEAVRSGQWTGSCGDKITDIVNIGIGGSDLGPAMVCEGLVDGSPDSPKLHFCSNVDGEQLRRILLKVRSPATTLFIVVSKTFTTQETLKNAQVAKEWLTSKLKEKADFSKHFIAVSTNKLKVEEFGIDSEKGMVGFWDWVGGRYSVWSAVGLSVVIGVGRDRFEQFLSGAKAVDDHFRTDNLTNNIPVLMALLSFWYVDFFKCQTQAILPYEQSLSRFPAYLQQLEMESNGKSYSPERNSQVDHPTSPVIWGEPGTNGQHAFFQQLHQGTVLVPCDFLAGVNPPDGDLLFAEHHQLLLSNFLAQTRALMLGRQSSEPFRLFPGNKPSTSILYSKLNPVTLGALIALYEHKVFTLGCLWNINSFDQFGVELGKEMAGEMLSVLRDGQINVRLDSSTALLVDFIKSV